MRNIIKIGTISLAQSDVLAVHSARAGLDGKTVMTVGTTHALPNPYALSWCGATNTSLLDRTFFYVAANPAPSRRRYCCKRTLSRMHACYMTQFWVRGLSPNTRYGFRVRAFNGFGPGVYAHGCFATRPARPAAPVAVKLAPTEVTLQWVFGSRSAAKVR